MKLGDTFIRFPPDDREEHLWIAVTDPNKNGGNFAAFNLTRSLGGKKALTFRIGDHPFIKKYDSDVNFGDALIFNLANVQNEFIWQTCVLHQPMKIEMVRLIAARTIGHPAVPEEVEDLVKAEWGL